MIGPVSQRTYALITELTERRSVAGIEVEFCPCRVLPETVLNLKTVMREVERLWVETLGVDAHRTLVASEAGADFFTGRVRMVEVQEGRPDMVAVWLPVPPDFPGRIRVQIVDALEPDPFP